MSSWRRWPRARRNDCVLPLSPHSLLGKCPWKTSDLSIIWTGGVQSKIWWLVAVSNPETYNFGPENDSDFYAERRWLKQRTRECWHFESCNLSGGTGCNHSLSDSLDSERPTFVDLRMTWSLSICWSYVTNCYISQMLRVWKNIYLHLGHFWGKCR